jgi:3-hydroxybutyryl-CoA dehydrogenase
MHFFNPAPLMPLVEVVPGELTDPAVVAGMLALVTRLGHTGVRVADTPGFLVNHAGRAYSTEALRLLDEGVAPAYDIDRILREAAGFRMGPFELFDLTGLDVSQPVMEGVWAGFYGEPRLAPSPTGRRRLAAGRLGRKSGSGFYAYEDGVAVVPPEPAAPAYDGTPIYVNAGEPDGAALGKLLDAAGVTVLTSEAGAADVAVVTPWGDDVTTAALGHRLPAERTVGVDPFGRYAGRLTLAGTPATSERVLRAAWGALAATGRPVTVVRDSPGFVAQRVVAAVVNLATEIAQLGIASPADVDVAVRLALGYPHGPLSWGDSMRPRVVLTVLDGLWAATRDPRYRPSLWLSRRARLRLSLLDAGPSVLPGPGLVDGSRTP